MRYLVALILTSQCFGAAEILQGFVRGITPWDSSAAAGGGIAGLLSGQSCDHGNLATSVTVKISLDDSTFAGTGKTVGGLSCNGTSNWTYNVLTGGTIDGIDPLDGAQHYFYVKVVSNTSPGAGDQVLPNAGYPTGSALNQGFPFKYDVANSAILPAFIANTVGASSRLTAAQTGILVNTSDTYSVGSNTGGATRVCIAPNCGSADIWSNGTAAIFATAHGIPYDATHFCAATVTVQQNLAVASAGTVDTCRAQFAAASGAIQQIAIAWVQPSLVTGVSYNMSITGYVALGTFPTGLLSTSNLNWFCPESSDFIALSTINPFYNHITSTPFTDSSIFMTMMLVGEVNQHASNTFTGPWVADAPTFSTMVSAAVAAINSNPSNKTVYQNFTDDVGRRTNAVFLPSATTLTNATYSRPGTSTVPIACSANITSSNILYWGGACTNVPFASAPSFVSGAGVAYNVTSTAGRLPYDGNQTPIAYWLANGAVGSAGGVQEPCALQFKFPDPILFNGLYQQGVTVAQALWGSIRIPYDRAVAGDPLAAPFSQASSSTGGSVTSGRNIFSGNLIRH